MIFDLIDAVKNADLYTIIAIALTAAVLLFICLPYHEFAHAFAAYKLGDYTAKYQGRLSLNPFRHLDPIGSLMILAIGIGYAKPVPVNMMNFKNRKRDMAITAAAGPLMNLLFGIVFAFLSVAFANFFVNPYLNENAYNIIFGNSELVNNISTIGWSDILQNDPSIKGPVLYCIYFIFDTVTHISISLAIFNLIPIPPFDGSRILGYFLPDRIYYKLMQYEQIIFIFVMIALWFGFLSGPLGVMISKITNGIYWLVSLPFGGF